MELMPIRALAEAVAAALAVDYDGPANGQIRAIPDARSIRYYTTLGLLDRPAAMDGRTALYGKRHLQQLVAIKRLQAEGLSLAEIQAKMQGVSPRALAALAKLPAAPGEASGETKRTRSTKPRSAAFWREEPAMPPPRKDVRQSLSVGMEIEGVTLLFRPARTIDEADAAALREAAAPLLRVLEARGLIAPLEAERNER